MVVVVVVLVVVIVVVVVDTGLTVRKVCPQSHNDAKSQRLIMALVADKALAKKSLHHYTLKAAMVLYSPDC